MGYFNVEILKTKYLTERREFNDKKNKIIFINPLADTRHGISADVRSLGEYESKCT